MTQELSRREEQRGWRVAYLWAIPIALVAGLVLVVAAYWDSSVTPDTGMEETATPGTTETTEVKPTGTAAVMTEEMGQYGTVLTDDTGHPLYLFTGDTQGQGGEKAAIDCDADCAKAWPPLLSAGAPKAHGGANGDLLGTVSRKNGAAQVTYNGWPLYRYAKDSAPDRPVGQDVKDFGGEWYLVKPSGEKVSGS